MKIEPVAMSEYPGLQFVVYAETPSDRVVIAKAQELAISPTLKPMFHGCVYAADDKGYVSFNFGWVAVPCIEKAAPAPPKESMTLAELQEAVQKGWTGELYSDEFKGRQSAYKDFDHALKHIRKAAQALENMTEKADHGGEFCGPDWKAIRKYVADLVISSARLANVSPCGVIDFDKAVRDRVEEKILPKK